MNPNAALREILVANAALNSATSGRIYGPPGLPRTAIDLDSVSFLVSDSDHPEGGGNAPVQVVYFDVACWGASVEDCWTIYDLLFTALDNTTGEDTDAGRKMAAAEVSGGTDEFAESIERPFVACQYRITFRRA